MPGPSLHDYIVRLRSAIPGDSPGAKAAALYPVTPVASAGYLIGRADLPREPLQHLPIPATVPQEGPPHIPREYGPRHMAKGALAGQAMTSQATAPARSLLAAREPKSQAEADARGRAWLRARQDEVQEDMRRAEEQTREEEDPEMATLKERGRRMDAALEDFRSKMRK